MLDQFCSGQGGSNTEKQAGRFKGQTKKQESSSTMLANKFRPAPICSRGESNENEI